MPMDKESDYLSVKVAGMLPYLRRYARALTGSQTSGDRYAAATLEALLTDRSVFQQGLSDKVALFRAFHLIWSSAGAPIDGDDVGIARRAQRHLSRLTSNTREALLLHTVEEFPDAEKQGKLRLVGSRAGRDGSLTIHQDVDLYASLLAPGDSVTFSPAPDRKVWVQVVRGNLDLNGAALRTGDGAAAVDEADLTITAEDDSEFLLFDLA